MKEAKSSFEGLEKPTRIKATMGEVQLAFMKTGVGFAEAGISFGSQLSVRTFKEGKIESPKFYFKSTEEMMRTPSVQPSYKWHEDPAKWFGEAITTRPALTMPIGAAAGLGYGIVKGGIGAVKTYGFKTGVIETTKYFSPLRIKSTVFAPKITAKTKFTGKAVEITKAGKITQVYKGHEVGFKDIKLYSEQVSVKGMGVGRTVITTPEFHYVAGKLTMGGRGTEFATFFAGKPTGEIGFKGKAITKPMTTLFAEPTIKGYKGGIKFLETAPYTKTEFRGLYQPSPKDPKVFRFVSGEPVSGFERVSKFFGEYKYVRGFRPQVSGTGYKIDMTKPSVDSKSWIKMFRGAGKVDAKGSFQKLYGVTTTPVIDTKAVSQVSKMVSGAGASLLPATKLPVTKQVLGKGLIQETKLKPITKTYFPPITTTITKTKTRGKYFTPTRTTLAPVLAPIEKTKLGLGFAQPQVLKEKQRYKLKTKQLFKQTFRFPKPTITIPSGFGFGEPFSFPLLPRLRGARGKRKKKGVRPTRKTKYVPTIAAMTYKFTAPKIPRGYIYGAGGIIRRPQIVRRKKKRRKK